MEQVILTTDRLLLKELNPEIMAIVMSYTDAALMEFLGVDEDGLKTERANYEKGLTNYRLSFKSFLLVMRDSGKVIGRCGFHTWYILHDRAEIGYHIQWEEDKGRGYMKEAMTAIVAYGFEHMGLHRIEAFIGPGNAPSIKLATGLGFREEGLLREHYLKGGEYQDSLCFGLLKADFLQGRAPIV